MKERGEENLDTCIYITNHIISRIGNNNKIKVKIPQGLVGLNGLSTSF
jgi:hypothetical protein